MSGLTRNVDERRTFIASVVLGFGFMLVVFFVLDTYHPSEPMGDPSIQEQFFSKENHTAFSRKLLALPGDGDGDGDGSTNRVGATCSKDNIVVIQGQTAPLPNGIPTYTVEISNACVSGCSISNIHLSCGWFSSARLINPKIFRRIFYNDCLVNDGAPLSAGESLSFAYANTFSYPLLVSSITC